MLDEFPSDINRPSPTTRRTPPGAATQTNDASQPSVESSHPLEQQLSRLETHMASLQEQVQRLQRLASLGTVAAMLAHEFNNMLTPIISYSQYALSHDDPALLRTAVEKTHKNSKRLAALCDRVLGMAVDDQMGSVTTKIKPLLLDAVECVGRDLEKDSIDLSVEAPDDLTAKARAGSLRQVLFNLVLNARQAMLGREGRLRLTADRTEDGRVRIDVADSGSGIKPENLERIFEPFFTTKTHENKTDRRGIGLGLHICRQLMTEQDGSISAASEPGRGTTFTLTLPGDDGN